jgi:hypothetical protein
MKQPQIKTTGNTYKGTVSVSYKKFLATSFMIWGEIIRDPSSINKDRGKCHLIFIDLL